jgi:hypothetical protein
MKKLLALVVALATAAGISVAIATASSAPIVITYEKTCTAAGHCVGSTGNGGTITMDVTGFRPTGDAAQLEMSETITGGGRTFTADLSAHSSPAGFIVLNGVVTDSSDPSLIGAQVHQRSNLDPGSATHWTGELRVMPAST